MDRDEVSDGDASDFPDERDAADDRAHLAGVAAGCGCVEVWEHLSERRAADADGGADAVSTADD